jgi:quercetin dioxygenase-like cupin family protein
LSESAAAIFIREANDNCIVLFREKDKGALMGNENPWIEICPGIRRQTMASGQSMYQMLALLVAGSKMPAHRHPQEQIVHILQGRMNLIVEGNAHELTTGESFYLASNVLHGVETFEETRVLDTFSPPRDEYLAIDEVNRKRS